MGIGLVGDYREVAPLDTTEHASLAQAAVTQVAQPPVNAHVPRKGVERRGNVRGHPGVVHERVGLRGARYVLLGLGLGLGLGLRVRARVGVGVGVGVGVRVGARVSLLQAQASA